MGKATNEWRYGWRVVVGCSIGMACGSGTINQSASLFIPALQDAFGWSRGQITVIGASAFVVAFMGPIAGYLVDRFGVRAVLLPAMATLALTLVGLANQNGDLLTYYALHTLLVIAGYGTTGVTFSRAVTGWFLRGRGLALAASRVGVATAWMLVPPLLYRAIEQGGYQWGYYALAAMVGLIGLPAAWLLVREPESGQVRAERRRPTARAAWGRILRDWRFYVMIAMVFLQFPITAFVAHAQPLLIGKGLAPAAAASTMAVIGGSVFAGVVISGALLDRFWAPLVGIVFSLAAAAGFAIFLQGTVSPAMAIFAVMLIGLNQGAEIDVLAYVISRYFSRDVFSTSYGVATTIYSVAQGFGMAIFGYLYDRAGNYDGACLLAIVTLVAAAAAFCLFGRYPRFETAPEAAEAG